MDLVLAALLSACATAKFEKSLDPGSRDFFSKVRLIITAEERRTFMSLPSESRKDFIQDFWVRRDPTPGTPENQYKDTYFRRIEEANKLFRDGPQPGWLQDRGRIYVTLGPPDYRETYPRGITYYGLPTEVWWYGFFPVVFVDTRWIGDYQLDPSSANQIAEIGRAQVYWNEAPEKKPRAVKGAAPEFDVKVQKNDPGGATLLVVLPYREIWFKAQGGVMRAELKLDVKVLGSSGAEVWAYAEKYPVEIPENQLTSVLGKDYEIRVTLPVGPGQYTVKVGLTNTNDGSRAEAERKFEI